MPPYLLSQLASRYNPQAPKFTTPEFSTQEDYQNTIKFAQEQERLNNLKAYGAMAGRAKINEDVSAKKAKIDAELKLLREQRATALEGTPFAVSLDQKIASLEEQANNIQPDIKTVVDATRIAIAPENSSSLSNKNYTVMAEKQAAIDSKWLEINGLLRQIQDPNYTGDKTELYSQIDKLKAEAIEFGREYALASQGTQYKSQYENDANQLASAMKNSSEAFKAQADIGKTVSDAKKALLDDATEAVKTWTDKNSETIKNMNNLASSVTAYESVKQQIKSQGKQVSPAQFTALVKSISKMILPAEAVMADDAAMLADFGGGKATNSITALSQIGQQIAEVVGPLFQGGKEVVKEVTSDVGDAAGKLWDAVTGQATEQKSQSQSKAPVKTASKTFAQTYAEAKGVLTSAYIAQVPRLIQLGDIYAKNSIALIDSVKDAAQTMIMQMPDYITFRNTDALKASTGKSAKELLATPEGKNAYEVAIQQAMNSQFAKIKLPGISELNLESVEEAPVATATTESTFTSTTTAHKTDDKKSLSTADAKKKLEAEKAARAKAKADEKKRREEAERKKVKVVNITRQPGESLAAFAKRKKEATEGKK